MDGRKEFLPRQLAQQGFRVQSFREKNSTEIKEEELSSLFEKIGPVISIKLRHANNMDFWSLLFNKEISVIKHTYHRFPISIAQDRPHLNPCSNSIELKWLHSSNSATFQAALLNVSFKKLELSPLDTITQASIHLTRRMVGLCFPPQTLHFTVHQWNWPLNAQTPSRNRQKHPPSQPQLWDITILATPRRLHKKTYSRIHSLPLFGSQSSILYLKRSRLRIVERLPTN